MTAFRYAAARADGATVRGRLEAASRPDAAALLSARGLYPVLVEAEPAGKSWWPPRPSVRSRAVVIQSLATLVDAGLPLEKALAATEQVATGRLKDAVARATTRVREGASLATALDAEPGVFSGVTLGLIRAGERGVGLGPALEQAANQLDREAESAARVRTALAYPALLAVAGSVSSAVIVLFVVPRFAAILGDLGETLPAATRALIGLSNLVRHYGLLLVGLVLAGVAFASTEVVRRRVAFHRVLLRVPLIGDLRLGLATARVARTLAALLDNGTPALQALSIAQSAAGDAEVAERIVRARDRVAEGASVSVALAGARALTPTALQLLAVGEQSGRVGSVLRKAADLDEARAERSLRVLVGLLEPALIIAFAGMVAFVAAALLQAVYSVRPQ
ncbi:MAG TPA: type II secretion system F family protein [Gemmatimonadales bacterium]|nr:type II secretion system F family protein [Gemmatimonadales bacterium]